MMNHMPETCKILQSTWHYVGGRPLNAPKNQLPKKFWFMSLISNCQRTIDELDTYLTHTHSLSLTLLFEHTLVAPVCRGMITVCPTSICMGLWAQLFLNANVLHQPSREFELASEEISVHRMGEAPNWYQRRLRRRYCSTPVGR